MFGKSYDVWLSFGFHLSYKLQKYFDKDTMLIVKKKKKKKMSDIIFEMLPFRVYNHLFYCCRGFYFYNKCTFCTRFQVKEALSS